MARPRKDVQDSRRKVYRLRLTDAERAALDAAAAARQTSPAELLRSAFMDTAQPQASRGVPAHGGMPAAVLDVAAVAALNRVGANLNQLARRANAGDTLQPGELPEVLASLGQTLGRIEALVFANLE